MSVEADLACGMGLGIGLVTGLFFGVLAARTALRSRVRRVEERETILEGYARYLGRMLRSPFPLTRSDWLALIDHHKPAHASRREILRALLDDADREAN